MQHREFSLPERQFMEMRLLGKWSLRRIAADMGRDHSALSREVRKGRCPDGRYRADEAQKRAEARKRKSGRGKKLDRDPELAGWVRGRLGDRWSPERIAGRLKAHPPPGLEGKYACHETIYQWLHEGDGRYGGLHKLLWSSRKRRYARKGRKPKKAVIEGRTPISERPADGLPGHLETDSMVWHGSRGLLSAQVDRATLVCRLRWCPDRTAGETAHALRRTAETLPHRFVRSVAFDNGSESARHGILTEEYGVPTFFCEPYASWQKPQVENLNRTIRHWVPRKTKAQDLAALDWKTLEDWLNNLPRKSLNYLTPNEALNQYLTGGATKP